MAPGIVHVVARLVLLSMAAQLVVESSPRRLMTARAYEMVFSDETITDFTTGAIDVASLLTQDWLSLPLGGFCGLAAKYITPHTFNTPSTRGTLHTTFEYLTQECTIEYKHDINTCALLDADFAVCLGFPLDSRTSHRPWGYCSNQNARVSYLWVPNAISNYTTMASWNLPKRSQRSQSSNLQISSLVVPSSPVPSVKVPAVSVPSVSVPSVSVPSVSVPSVSVPSVSVPSASVPSVSVPSVSVPSVSVPSVSVPSVSVPSVSVPSVSVPSVSVPSVSVPSISVPSVSVPSVPVPSVPIPSVPIPSAPIPSAPIPSVPVPSVPTPSVPTPSVPTPSVPTPSVPTPSVPTPTVPAPSVPTPSVPTPSLPTPSFPTPSLPTPSLPTPLVPVPTVPAPSVPTPSLPTPSLPTPLVPVPTAPAPSVPTPTVPAPSVPTPSLPTPSLPTPLVPVPTVPAPSVPTPSLPTPSLPTPLVPVSTVPAPSVPTPSLPTPSLPTPSLPTPLVPVLTVPAPSVPPVCLSHGQPNKTATDPVALARIYKDVPTLNRVVEATGSRIGAEFAATTGRSCDWRHSNLIPVAWDGIQNVLMAGQSLLSPDGTYSLTMQYDCNLVVYKKRPDGTVEWNAKWASFSHYNDPFQHECSLELQPNGNLVVRDPSGEQRWSSGSTAPSLYSTALSVISCGNVIVLDMTTGTVIWATHTGHA